MMASITKRTMWKLTLPVDGLRDDGTRKVVNKGLRKSSQHTCTRGRLLPANTHDILRLHLAHVGRWEAELLLTPSVNLAGRSLPDDVVCK